MENKEIEEANQPTNILTFPFAVKNWLPSYSDKTKKLR